MADARALIATIAPDGASTIGNATALKDIRGWDSLGTVALVLGIEEHLARELTDDEVEGLRSVQDVQRLLDAR